LIASTSFSTLQTRLTDKADLRTPEQNDGFLSLVIQQQIGRPILIDIRNRHRTTIEDLM
jgi:hypothetical protein